MKTTIVSTSNSQLSPLIKRKTLFGNPERTNPRLSPDGKYVAYMAPDNTNVLQIWLRTIGLEGDCQLTDDPKGGYILNFCWTYQPKTLIYFQDLDGDENWHIYSVNIESKIVRNLTPFQGVQAELISLEPELPDEILVALNLNKPEIFDVYRINLNNGQAEFDTENPGNIVFWKANFRLKILAALAATSDGGYDLLYREAVDKPWQTLQNWSADDDGEIYGFNLDDKTLYLISSYNANTQRLLALDLTSKSETVIAEDLQYDVKSLFTHLTKRYIQAVAFYKDSLQWQVLDKSIAQDMEVIALVRSGEVNFISRDLADKKWLISYTTSDSPTYYYLYERESKSSTLLFSNRPELEEFSLVSMQPISYPARDKLTIHGYLTLPGDHKSPYPTVLLVHGGPWGRDTWWCNPEAQWLANRGYAVLQPNFRGSAGYGKAFLNAGNRQWGGAMHDDLIDGVNWLINEGIADKTKIAIMGTSYGGYAALVGLTFTPDVFACGIDLVGPSNLITFMQNMPPYWTSFMAMLKHRIGNIETEEEFLKSQSPLFFIDKIKKPLLIGQGGNDPRVKQFESEQIVDAMRDKGKLVEYVLYTDEGHGFARSENRLHFYAVVEEFLAKHLGGRCEPMGNIEGHSGIIK